MPESKNLASGTILYELDLDLPVTHKVLLVEERQVRTEEGALQAAGLTKVEHLKQEKIEKEKNLAHFLFLACILRREGKGRPCCLGYRIDSIPFSR